MKSAAPEEIVQTYLQEPSASKLRLPANSCDTHVHVFGPRARFAYASDRKATPAEAPKEALFALHKRYGIQRCVIVQSIIHGYDNTVVEDAIRAGQGNYLGIALTPIDVSDAELQRLASNGFRGVRFHFMKHVANAVKMSELPAFSHRLAKYGMHLQVHCESSLIHELGQHLRQSAVPVVIDHMGRVDATKGEDHEDFQALLKLMDEPHMRVKVSGVDRIESGARAGSGYPQGTALARLLHRLFPEQTLWGLDWPHPNHTHIPDDGELVDVIAAIAPTDVDRQRLLVSNPAQLYRFG